MIRNKLAAAAAAALMGLSVVGCTDVKDPAPFDPRTFNSDEQGSTGLLATNVKPPLPATLPAVQKRTPGAPATQPYSPPGFDAGSPIARMTLREIVQRAVVNNLDVKVAGYDPAIEGTRVVEQQAVFDPAFFTNLRYDKRDNATAGNTIFDPVTNTSFPVDTDESDTWTAETGLRQNLPSGGRAQLSYQAAYNDLEPRRTLLNPYWENNLQLEITQPLLRNVGLEINRANITIAQNNQRISTLEFRRVLEEQLSNIEQTYWQLVAAVEEVRIREDLLARTGATVQILVAREQQDVSKLQTSQARLSEEQRRSDLVRARARVGDLSDQLKRLMNDPNLAISTPTILLPGTDPLLEPVSFNLKEQIDAGLENRLELSQQQLRIASAGVAMAVAKNGLLPQLNLRGIAGFQGLDEDFTGAVSSQMDFSHFNWGIGLELEIPIGNRSAKAVYQRSLLQRAQAIEQYRVLVDQVSLDVKTAAREVETTWNEIVTGRNARFAAENALNSLQQREDANEPLTPTFVQLKLDTQERLAQARTTEATAISNYNFALARLERAKGTLLKYDNVKLEEDKQAFTGNIKQ